VHPALQAGAVPAEPVPSQPTEDQSADNEATVTPNREIYLLRFLSYLTMLQLCRMCNIKQDNKYYE